MYIHVSAYTMYVCTYIYYHYKHYANQTCSKPLLDFALMCLRSALCVCACVCVCVCVCVCCESYNRIKSKIGRNKYVYPIQTPQRIGHNP